MAIKARTRRKQPAPYNWRRSWAEATGSRGGFQAANSRTDFKPHPRHDSGKGDKLTETRRESKAERLFDMSKANGNGKKEPASCEEPKSQAPSMGKEVNALVQHIDALEGTLPLVMFLMFGHRGVCTKEYREFLRAKGELIESDADNEQYGIGIPYLMEIRRPEQRMIHANVGYTIMPRSFVVGLVSQFDFFLSRMLRCLFHMRPELLNASEKQIPFGQLLQFNDMNEAKEYVLEKEIDAVLRMSHTDQFAWLEKQFSLPLRKDLDVWPIFIEFTERRNLFVHCNGVVSSQYRAVCCSQGVEESELPPIGEVLDVTSKYFRRGYRCVFEIGVKLAHVLWRKVAPQDRLEADRNLNSTIYELIADEKYSQAIILGRFAVETLKKHATEEYRRMMIVNLAQAYKWSGEQKMTDSLLAKDDWSACAGSFQLALAVLCDRFDEAGRIMRRLGSAGEIKEGQYQHWPLFKEFRKTNEFMAAYEELYGHAFAMVQQAPAHKTKADESSLQIGEAIKHVESLLTEYDGPEHI
jgi:hypothetical protein